MRKFPEKACHQGDIYPLVLKQGLDAKTEHPPVWKKENVWGLGINSLCGVRGGGPWSQLNRHYRAQWKELEEHNMNLIY